MVEVRFLGHAAFEVTADDTRILVDPFLANNPLAPVGPDAVQPTHILLTHGHVDHWGDIVPIAQRTGAHCVALTEIAFELAGEVGGACAPYVSDPNLGGTANFDWGWVRLVPAKHTSTTPSGRVTEAAGLVIGVGDKTIYHLGDTALFTDLRLVSKRNEIDLALVCIGGHYTMDATDARTAVELIEPRTVIPCHYNTFAPIKADPQAFKSDVEETTSSTVVVLDPGDTYTLD